MTNITNTTGEPVTNRAPAPSTEVKTPDTTLATATTATGQTIQNALNRATLPNGYLANGSMLDAEGVMLPENLGKHAEELAKRLKPMKASTFNNAFLSKAKEANKKKVPYSAKKNCAQGMTIAALKLVNRKKDPAPAILLEMIRAVSASVIDPESFSAMYAHLDAVCTYLMME